MLRRVLFIDDAEDFTEFLATYLQREWPQVELTHYHPVDRGIPGSDFELGVFDLIVLDYQLGLDETTGLDWLVDLKRRDDCPTVIMLTAKGNEDVAVRAIKSGAHDYIRKEKLVTSRMIDSIKEALGERPEPHEITQTLLIPRSDLLDESTRPMSVDEITDSVASASRSTEIAAPPETAEPEADSGGFGITAPGYRFLSQVAKGGMSSVFLAERQEDGLQVVLKVLYTRRENDDPNALKRFMQEYNLISKLQHPNVVRIYERAFASDFAYIAMEHFPKGDLIQRIRNGVPGATALNLLSQIAKGLSAVHKLNVVHRDLKPGNVLFKNDSSLAITDFGIAKIVGASNDMTQDDIVLGTPYYMSPEQASGKLLDQRCDLYSLGVILYEMLTGRKPYVAETVANLIHAHVNEAVPRLSPELTAFQPLIDGLLAKDPDERFQNADELLAAVEWVES